jgi:hypothetical protein
MSSTPSNQGTSGKAIASLVLGILSLICIPVLPAIGGLVLGFVGLSDIKRGRSGGKGIAIAGVVTSSLGLVFGLCIGGLILATGGIRSAANRAKSHNNMRQLGLAMHNYHSTYDSFPPANLGSQPGRPQLSWRVAVLPYVEEDFLYRRFDQNAGWDAPQNKPFAQSMPRLFVHPEQELPTRSERTHYQVVVGPDTLFEAGSPHRISEAIRGTSNTIMMVEATEPVIWSKPQDVNYSESQPLPKFGVTSRGFNVVLADGSVIYFDKGTDEKVIRDMLKRK